MQERQHHFWHSNWNIIQTLPPEHGLCVHFAWNNNWIKQQYRYGSRKQGIKYLPAVAGLGRHHSFCSLYSGGEPLMKHGTEPTREKWEIPPLWLEYSPCSCGSFPGQVQIPSFGHFSAVRLTFLFNFGRMGLRTIFSEEDGHVNVTVTADSF